MAPNSILLIEDEPDVRTMIKFSLERVGFIVHEADTAESGLDKLNGRLPDLLIIDWMLPSMSGLDLIRRLRQDKHTAKIPMIMLTARGEESAKIKSFDSGVDDYLTKPFSPKELVARIKALLRRSGYPEDGRLVVHGLELDKLAHTVAHQGNPIHLRPTEYRLLELLMLQPNRAFYRNQLLDHVWGRDIYVDERTIDVHMLRLRKALAVHGIDGVIQTVRGIGYRLSSDQASV